MRRLVVGHLVGWVTVFGAAAASCLMWTAVAMLLTNWFWHTMAISVVGVILSVAIATCRENFTQLRRQKRMAIPDGRIETRDLRRLLGEETYEELSRLSVGRVAE